MQELKPCPFCGGKAKLKCDPENWGYSAERNKIECSKCNSSTDWYNWKIGDGITHADYSLERSEEEAIEAWNRRAPQEHA